MLKLSKSKQQECPFWELDFAENNMLFVEWAWIVWDIVQQTDQMTLLYFEILVMLY